jgi:hypothetical protein
MMAANIRSAGIAALRCWCTGGAVFLAVAVLTLPGCGGCRQAAKPATDKEKEKLAEEARKKKPPPKPDFERLELSAQPGRRKGPTKAIKPGHWVAASVQTKANNFDWNGELDTAATDAQGKLLDLEKTPFRLTTTRPALLPKGQNRRLEVALFVPAGGGRTRSWITSHLRDRRSGRDVKSPETEPFAHMPGYQYFLLGMVAQPDRYAFLKVINSVRPPWDDMMPGEGNYLYQVQLPPIENSVSLPADVLCWTSLAYIVWDDIDPTVLNVEQQQALLDWLHWGGQIIISGPKTLDRLRHSFLEPYLPAVAGNPLVLDDDRLAALAQHWTIAPAEGPARALQANQPWSGVTLEQRPGGDFLPGTGELVAERRAGRGRIVVTAFRLIERDLINWPSFDSFFNGCLLRRPPRRYSRGDSDILQLDWANFSGRRLDPELICQLRYFSRDTVLPAHPRAPQSQGDASLEDEDGNSQPANPFAGYNSYVNGMSAEEREQNRALGDAGVAGWNDFGPVASEARKALKQAAGITIPRREFVLKVLLVYLLVLVPLNWAVFRVLGRVEWAWIAAPLIAVVCAAVVVWLAQLDIGFARSSTEIAVLEVQGGYTRAHVTRYTALYTSLSTTYEVNLEQPSALALPFSSEPRFELLAGQERSTVNFRRDNGAHLSGYAVSSNATGMIHSEHMADLEGAITLESSADGLPRVTNSTRLPLRDAGVIRRRADDAGVDIAWVGALGPGDTAELKFKPADDDLFVRERQDTPLTAHEHPADTLSLGSLFDLAENPAEFVPGDMRLVAWLDAELPGLRIEPAAAQERHATLVVVHLNYGPGRQPAPDANLPRLVQRIEPESIDEPFENLPDGPME